AIGAHVGNEAHRFAEDIDTLIKALRNAHRATGAEAELARCLLLQGRGSEGSGRVAARLLLLDGRDNVARVAQDALRRGARGRLASKIELVEALAVEMGKAGREALAARGGKLDLDGPILARLEGFDFAFALADQAERHRLHAAGRAASRQFSPQHRRKGKSHEVIERATREVGLDQFAVQFPRMPKGIEHGRFRDLVEDDALDVDTLERLAVLQHLLDVPGDRFALAVRVGGEIDVLGALDRLGDLLEALLGLAGDLPGHGEVLVGTDGAVLGRKVADMAIARQDLVALAQVFVDGLRLGRRLDDDDVHRVNSVPKPGTDSSASRLKQGYRERPHGFAIVRWTR